MFNFSPYGRPGSRYRDIDVAARVEGATPHGLIAIMFDELLKSIDTLSALESAGDSIRRNAVQARATSLLHGLESALNYESGGEIAANLGRIYREARRLIGIAPGSARADALKSAREMLADIAGAWAAIG